MSGEEGGRGGRSYAQIGGKAPIYEMRTPDFILGLLGSQGCSNKVRQTGWLKTIEIYSLIALEMRGLMSGVCWTTLPPRLGRILPRLFLMMAISSWLATASLPIPVSVFL